MRLALLLGLMVIVMSSCGSVNTRLSDVTDFYLKEQTRRTFNYTRTLPGGDNTTGTIIYNISGKFSDNKQEASYTLSGVKDMVVNYNYSDPMNIMDLPQSILLQFYSQSQIDTVITRRKLSKEEREHFANTLTGDFYVTEYNEEKAPSVFTKAVQARHQLAKSAKVNSALFGNAHLYLDEAGAVWLKELLMATNLMAFGTYSTTAILRVNNDIYEVRQKFPLGKLTFQLERAKGLVYLEIRTSDGIVVTLEEVKSE